MLSLLRRWLGLGPKVNFKELIEQGAVVVDVRTLEEYRAGHLSGSINIPLDHLPNQIAALKRKDALVITVCRSGMRSRLAAELLSKHGIKAYNGGAWTSLRPKLG
ncbi:MAG: rhodanese-like domain-containing protein [Saprospiraceae bacterium]|nr:rhodanese-like domain-containing protein [Saprospiraceae bacterium]MDW8484041.1 rhodanese-like domain-containing protein [Saprospiraceae bacterium]